MTSDPIANRETVLILTPLSRFYPQYFENLQHLTYPHDLISIGSGEAGSAGEKAAVFRDCVLVKKGSNVGDVARKIMGDVPIAFVETVGGVRVSEEDEVGVGKNDVCHYVQRLQCTANPLRSSRSKSEESEQQDEIKGTPDP